MDESMTDSYLEDMLEKMHHRQDQFIKAGKMFYSPAYEGLKETLPIWDKAWMVTADINTKKKSIRALRDFFNYETSSVKGARRVMQEQDKLIFGEDEKGKPLRRMSYIERTSFWALAKEYERGNGAEYALRYRDIWNYISDLVVQKKLYEGWPDTTVFNPDDKMRKIARNSFVTADRIAKIKELLKEQMKNEPPDTTPNIFSGSWYAD